MSVSVPMSMSASVTLCLHLCWTIFASSHYPRRMCTHSSHHYVKFFKVMYYVYVLVLCEEKLALLKQLNKGKIVTANEILVDVVIFTFFVVALVD